ncbi:MAG: gamma-glutamyl-gamma-aminobutyrate hydrolase family protein [Vulcanimicrobiota bacterium]
MKRTSKLFLILLLLFSFSFNSFIHASEKPRIGLPYDLYQGEKFLRGKDPLINYRNAIEASGGRTVVLAQNYGTEFLKKQIAQLDGLLLPGGYDVNPSFYGEERYKTSQLIDVGFDQFEMDLLDYAKANKLPVLGICRGEQILNVFYGGSLYQDIPLYFKSKNRVEVTHRIRDEKTRKNFPCFHNINIKKDSRLYEIMGETTIRVNSYHRQAVRKLAPGMAVSATADDGLIEAIEMPGEVFIMGLQFHPERLIKEDPRFDAIFETFIEEARKTRVEKQKPEMETVK